MRPPGMLNQNSSGPVDEPRRESLAAGGGTTRQGNRGSESREKTRRVGCDWWLVCALMRSRCALRFAFTKSESGQHLISMSIHRSAHLQLQCCCT